jgi:hypothetical protein
MSVTREKLNGSERWCLWDEADREAGQTGQPARVRPRDTPRNDREGF